MKSKWIALLLTAVLLPASALAAMPEEAWTLQRTQNTADTEQSLYQRQWEIYDAAASAGTLEDSMDVLREIIAASPRDLDTYLICAQARFWVDPLDDYAELSYQWLEEALSMARDERVAEVAETYADQLMYVGRDHDAADMIRRVMDERGQTQALQVLLANTLYYVDMDGAFAVLEEVLTESPVNFDAQTLYAQLLIDACRWDEALAAYRQIDTDWPDYMIGLYGQYNTYYASGEFEQAARTLDRMLMFAKSDDELWLERANLRLWPQALPEKAIEEADALLRVYPDWTDAAAIKTEALRVLGEFAQARETAWRIVELDPEYGQLLLAAVDMSEGNWEDARARMLALDEKSEGFQNIYTTLAQIYLDGFDDADAAMQAIAEAFDEGYSDNYAVKYLRLGQVYQRQQAYEEAARAYAAADERAYLDTDPLYHLVMLYMQTGRAQDMQDAMREMERRYPGWDQTIWARVQVENVLGNAAEALAAFEQYKEKFPFLAEGMQDAQALLEACAGDPQGMEQLKESAQDAQAPLWTLDALARAQLETGDLDGALATLDEADARMETAPETEESQASLLSVRAQVMLEMGKIDESVALYKQAAELDWPLYMLALRADYETLKENEAFVGLMAAQKQAWDTWDLTVPPSIPERK